MMIKIGNAFIDPSEIAAVVDYSDPVHDEEPEIEVFLRANSEPLLIRAAFDEAEAALIDAGYIEDPGGDPIPEMSAEEIKELADLNTRGYKFLARDGDDRLYAYMRKPKKDGAYWDDDPDPGQPKPARVNSDFEFIDDDRLWSIEWLLCN